jgi:hypothetical protein
MEELERKGEARRQNRFERFGTTTPRCAVCGMKDDRCLEVHHIAGRKFDDTTVILCRPSLHDCIGNFLKGLAYLFVMLAAKMHEFGDALIAFAKSEAASALGGAQ